MSAESSVSVEAVGAVLCDALHDVRAVSKAWVSVHRDAYDVWLLVEPVDMAGERELYRLEDPLHERFPDALFSLHILNPLTYADLAPEAVVPRGAHYVGVPASA